VEQDKGKLLLLTTLVTFRTLLRAHKASKAAKNLPKKDWRTNYVDLRPQKQAKLQNMNSRLAMQSSPSLILLALVIAEDIR
jgi:hypothetical protein